MGEKKYRLDLVQMLTMLHIFRLLHEGINNSNSSLSTEMQEILTKVIQTVDRYKIISLCQIILEYMRYSLWCCLLFLVGIADELVIHDIAHKIMKLHHEDKILEELGSTEPSHFSVLSQYARLPSHTLHARNGQFHLSG